MGNAELSYAAPEDAAPSLVPAVDITFSRPSAAVKGARTSLRFRKLRVPALSAVFVHPARGHLLLSRASSTSRKAARQDRVLSSNNGSSATALHADSARATPPATAAAQPGKGAADFRIPGLRDSPVPPSTAFASSMPAMSRRDVEDAGPPSAQPLAQSQPLPARRPRGPKLVRNPNNTCHRPRSHPSRFSQSMDFVRPRARNADATAAAPRSRPLTQLLSCCSPISLFRRGASNGSMCSDASGPRPADPSARTSAHLEADSASAHRAPVARPHLPSLVRESPLVAHVRPIGANTAVAVGSLDDHTAGGSRGSSSGSNGPKYVGAPDDTDDAAESDWLVSRSDRDRSSFGPDDYSSPGSGLPGIAAGSAMPVPTAGPVDRGTHSTRFSDLDTDPAISTPSDSYYRTPPTSLGDMPGASSRMLQGAAGLGCDSTPEQPAAPSDIPTNTMAKLYLGDEAYEHVPRRLTADSSIADPESLTDGVDLETGDDDTDGEGGSLRAEITSPPNNVVSESSERLVTHVEGQALLPPLPAQLKGRKCLVLDLDETLVHSSFREVDQPDYVVPVILEGQEHSVYVVKRPGVDEFINIVGQYYEVVVFTASLSMYADPVLDLLDKSRAVHHRLFRESCNLYNGNYVKDLSRLGRDVTQSIIIDNSPASYAFHPNNAIGISTWLNDPMDTELRDLIPFLIDLTRVDDVSAVLSLTHNQASFAQD
ncbi:hypothetical protein LPJ61_002618 [Coemansia biformis]|uniref:FCP1 homology domain-containing protein n=1 Tax=Coemansia biformis TaxID=1286918 RepID=A0A9W8CYH5_9FUNG|nr:hypothetical protein LPJ61_002618 [Coemansia biformis]